MNNKLFLFGTGEMSMSYAKVLMSMNVDFTVIGRGLDSSKKFSKDLGIEAHHGGIENYQNNDEFENSISIVAVNIDSLFKVTSDLISLGCKKILVEKPGFLHPKELHDMSALAKSFEVEIYIGYNRRFYSSVKTVKKLIADDGGLISMHFDFTEWSQQIALLQHKEEVKRSWVYGNSSHIIDLAFFISGNPAEIHSLTSKNLSWHEPAVFSGTGFIDNSKTLFSYHANWLSPGRWGIELMTAKRRYILIPIEKLYFMEHNSVEKHEIPLDNYLDVNFKPGLFNQVACFLESNKEFLCTIEDQIKNIEIFSKIGGYNS